MTMLNISDTIAVNITFKELKSHGKTHSLRKALMLSMKDNISLIRALSVEEDFLHSPDSFDIMLFAEFGSRDELMQYIAHPYHAQYIQTESAKYVSDIRIMDFEF